MKYTVKDFSLEEKLLLLTGKDNWSINDLNGKLPAFTMADGPSGLRKIEKFEKSDLIGVTYDANGNYTVPATAMPTLSVVANTWDESLCFLDGSTIADDCIEHDVDMLLAPGVNIKRNTLNGRNFEYFSEDPFLAGKMGRAFIEGVQSKGVGTSLKHFVANNSEHDRNGTSSEVDERTLREIYLPAFEESVKAKPWTVMCSYNPVNGIYASANKKMLKKVLRDSLDFDGAIVSDWWAVHDHPKAVQATCDLRMPYCNEAYEELKSAYEKGDLTIEEIDFCVQNILNLIEKAQNADKKITFTKEQRHENAVHIAKEGIVLLKNEKGVLPLKEGTSLAVLGQFNMRPPLGGGGSSAVTTAYEQKPLSELLEKELKSTVHCCRASWGDTVNTVSLLRFHYEKAYHSDAAIVCVGEQAPIVAEGCDRENMRLTAVQEDIILNTAKYNDKVIVLVYGGGAIDMSAWIDKVQAVVFVGFAGEGVNEALTAILTGKTVPSGKLTETFPLCKEDTVTKGLLDNGLVDWYKEGIFVGYRHYDREQKEVLYPFGHGLSYASFAYSNLAVESAGRGEYLVSYDITNTSDIDGKEVSQVYIKDMFASVVRPEKELKGFSKDLIKAGETKRITVKLNARSFAYYSVALDEWTVENGDFVVMVGASSRDIRLTKQLRIEM